VNSPQENIVGEWSVSFFDSDIKLNGVDLGSIPPELLGLTGIENQLLTLFLSPNSSSLFEEVIIEFTADGHVNITSADVSENGITYVLINENKLLLRMEDEDDIVLEIIDLSASNMEVIADEFFQIDLTEDGIDEEIEAILTISLVKTSSN
jgi:hypothetical protein